MKFRQCVYYNPRSVTPSFKICLNVNVIFMRKKMLPLLNEGAEAEEDCFDDLIGS